MRRRMYALGIGHSKDQLAYDLHTKELKNWAFWESIKTVVGGLLHGKLPDGPDLWISEFKAEILIQAPAPGVEGN